MTTCVRCITLFLFLPLVSFSQLLTGELRDTTGEKLDGASVVVLKLDGNHQSYGVVAHHGEFEVKLDNAGSYRVTVSHVGYKTYTEVISIDALHSLSVILEPDIMGLNEIVVTGTFEPSRNLESSIAISTLSATQMGRNRRGIASLLQEEPGIYADASAGEVFTRVYARGISISAEDDLGWYYISLQEDGLPVTAVQFASFAPDFFYRPDNTVDHVEVLRGGSSSIFAGNSPGGVINSVSKTNGEHWSGKLDQSFGWHANGNSFLRSDVFVSGPLKEKWSYGIGGHFRKDEGARDNDYKKFSHGGQIKFSLKKKIKRGEMIFHVKYLNDHVNRWTGVTAENWADPTAAYDQNLKYTAQLLPDLETKIPDGQGGSYTFNPSNGINTIDRTAGFILNKKIGKWELKNNFKASVKSANWQTSLSNAKVDLNSPLPYFISGADFPVGQVAFYDSKNQIELARIDNAGVLNGSNPSFTYLSGSLPFDAILGISAWYKDDRNTEFIDQFLMSRHFKNHHINGGVFFAKSNVSTLTRASFGYATYEARPRMMKVTLENPGQETLHLSDDTGVSNYGGLFLEKGDAAVNQLHWFLSDKINISNSLSVDVGFRIESQNIKGSKYDPTSSSVPGGADNNPGTAYDKTILVPSEVADDFDFNYKTISFSSGATYTLNSDIAFFGRISKGTKTPELDYYFSNYPGVRIPEKGPIQKIAQVEGGAKISNRNFSIIPVLFWSRL
ncbi:MAG: carboxypeptidase regulatory-like domain-containing protein, partial [Cyclobacteriaceae bacterium]|nr:carboxypeptidase regulatory-like domain-containing protein [Cyclobacteriaceae bacterium]